MPQSHSRVYVHIVFSTKDRKPMIDKEIGPRLYEYLGGICRGLECNPVEVGGHRNHIHILCLLSRKVSQAKLVEEIKKQSSKWMKTIDPKYADFYWQRGYGIFSVNPAQVDIIIRYIQNQEEHHRNYSYQDEVRKIYRKYKVDFDERYVWD